MPVFSLIQIAAATSAFVQPAAPVTLAPAAPLARFADLPNVTVTYYDVSGRDAREVHHSITQRAPRDPATGRPVPATSDWSMKAAVSTSTTAGRCTITAARLDFAGTARMPRLVTTNGQPIPPALLASWQRYAAALEERQVAQLRFAYDRLPQVERAIRASNCRDWKTVAAAAIDKVRRDKAEARARDSTPMPELDIPEEELKERPTP